MASPKAWKCECDAEAALQTSKCHKEKEAWNRENMCPGNLPYYLWELEGIWVSRPWSRIESSFPVEWHLLWQVVHSCCCSKAQPDKYEKDFISHTVHWQARTNSKCEGCYCGLDKMCKMQKNIAANGTFKRKIELKKYSREEYVNSTATAVL